MNLRAQEQASLLPTIMHMRCLEACAMQNIFIYNKRREWNKIIDRAMAADFSWETSAAQVSGAL